MQITKKNNNLIISFNYNPAIISIIKNFDSRKYNAKTKEWSVPLIHVVNVLNILLPFKFQASKEVEEEYEKAIRKKEKIQKILASDFNKAEVKLIKKTKLPLFDFQKIGTGFLCVNGSSLLGDEPGCGKTIQTIASVLINNSQKNLIICPNVLKRNWADELNKWIKKPKIYLVESPKNNRDKIYKKALKEKKDFFLIINYELLLKDLENLKKFDKFDTIIADEATRVSNSKSKQSKLIKTISAKNKIAITGTPISNNIQNIWNILDFCHPGLLGTYYSFTEKYCQKNRWGGISGYKNLNDLKKHISDYMIRRKKSEVLQELPDKMFETIYVDLSAEERKMYNAVKNEIADELKEHEVNKNINEKYLSNILVKMVRLKQLVDSPELISDLTHSSKIEALKELLEDIMQNDSKVIIFTQFKEMAKILDRELQKYNPFLFTGDTSSDERYSIIKMFNENEKNKILIMTDAGTFGLNIQRANYIIHIDLPWSIEKIEQREGRAHRIGSDKKRALTVYKLIVQNSIDEYVLKILRKKQILAEDILGDKKRARKIKLSKKDIQEILQ